MFDARVIRKNARKYPQMMRSIVPRFLEEASIIVQADAKRQVPVDTGNLRGSISRQIKGNTAIVGSNVEYAEHVEYGTRHMQSRPYMRPAIDNNRKDLIRRLANMIRSAIRG